MTQLTERSMLPTAPRKEYVPGDVIGDKYRLQKLLGEGGMGSVWVAENMALRANVALKLIRADVAEASANERFLSEARLAARLQHAAIVRVFDFGKTQNQEPYIVMELLEGETLGQRLGRLGSLDPLELCQMLLPIIDALHSAHGHGIVHRDLKPDNVFIAKTDGGNVQPKLLDFGIAKLRGQGTFFSTKLTQAGTLIGSPDYMSPEQARGELDLDARSDVWAICVLAYECLVGKPPFHGDNYNALLWSIIHDEPVPITVFQAGDSELWRILKTGFAKDRTQRWESARRLGEALASWLESHGVVEDICNRSLQASWLPAERPTRPELAPFDPVVLPQPSRPSSPEALAPPPTLPSLRRPPNFSLWFAGLGLVTLLGALYLSSGEETGRSATATPAMTADSIPKTEVGRLQGARSADDMGETAPSPPPHAKPASASDSSSTSASEPSAGAAATGRASSAGAANGAAAREPGTAPVKAAWREAQRTLRVRDLAIAEDFNAKISKRASSPARQVRERSKPRASKATPKRKPPPRRKAPRPAPKPSVPEKSESSDFDFGI